MENKKVRVRFAPSPTGPLHIGGVRTALLNYLFAKNNNGDFIVRIEDTDQNRFVEGAEKYIMDSLKWCGIYPDESIEKEGEYGPYRQSERKHLYEKYAKQLINNNYAYYAFDTEDELNEMRNKLKKAKVKSPQYNYITRNTMKNSLTLSDNEVSKKLKQGDKYVIRIKIPRNENIRFFDEIRGWIIVNSSNIDDKIIFKSDGMPTYHLANVIDDSLMKITHVIRGEEWLPSTPLHILLYKYLQLEETTPKFAHLPLILKPDGNGKLSKRDSYKLGFPIFPLEWKDPTNNEISLGYREYGYFPEAFVNYISFLGWNPGTNQEIFTLKELIENFSIKRVNKSGSKFDVEKAKWFNQQYLKLKNDYEIAKLILPILTKKNIKTDIEYIVKIVKPLKERAQFINDIINDSYMFFEKIKEYNKKFIEEKWNKNTNELLLKFKNILIDIKDFNKHSIENLFKTFLKDNNLKFKEIGPNLRIAITNKIKGPSLFEICEIFGKEEIIERLNNAIKTIKK